MNELERIVAEASRIDGAPRLLATVVRVRGSSYRRPGARMLVAGDRWVSGCVSGGCLEGDVMLRGWHRCRGGPVVVTYDSTSDEGAPWGVGLGCDGVVDVLLEPGDTNDALTFARACFAAETSGVLVTVIGGASVGARVAIGPEITLARPVDDPALRAALVRAASGPPGVVEVGDVTALVEVIAPSPQLFVLGSGHDVTPIVTAAQSAGFRVTVADRAIRERSRLLAADHVIATGGDLTELASRIDAAREAYVVIMHHQVDADRAALAMSLRSRARYVGLLGPARRTRALLTAIGAEHDARVHAPVGLDIGAETPEQIALAVVAEMCAVARGRRGGMLRERARAMHQEVAFVVLAAGGSTRLGRPKQLVELAGVPLVRRVAQTCLAVGGGPVGVVLGASSDTVAGALDGLRLARIENDGWREGIASSIRAAVAWAQARACGALTIVLADQPRIASSHLIALRDAWARGAPIAATRWRDDARDIVGAPAIFDRARWDALCALTGDRGAGALLRAEDVIAIDCADAALDVDTPDDVCALLGA
ncbi:XdhC family protein [Sandaracinus amylolyticus]|uniref:Xanthine and CO dehydrogenases maturation factor, XdhC/CoxF family n=1 Tax=Sandaracinus amylolyticus TaxID=927083 RepID=A0A0F6SE10_9BACT|nr:XdhC family protein [Sandaracinus amylolyticus]AKF04379.1 Xanthine and CO dehydrogenases maturation factor, XdhC/CoxF family [Sandaracinus amylolyticus]